MSEIDEAGPAFPRQDWTGMSLREWYAGMALQGIMASGDAHGNEVGAIAQEAYKLADAMIRAGKGE